jgi:hypothetical protein
MRGSEVSKNTTSRSRSITIVSVVFLVFGLGFAVATPLILAYVILNGSAPTLFGIEFLEGRETRDPIAQATGYPVSA